MPNNNTTTTTTKRKVSCMPCRIKKVKCDGEKPCNRCISKQVSCVYQKPGAVGRPPKNAVVNKLVLSRNNQNSSNQHNNNTSSNTTTNFCREFIFENISLTPILTPSRYLKDTKSVGLEYYLNTLFVTYFKKTAAIDEHLKNKGLSQVIRKGDYATVTPKVKIYDLTHYFTWMSADIANILMRRISKLKLTYYSDLEFSTTALAYDCTTHFFETPSCFEQEVVNPLNSLPPQQAIRLIECFFCIHPFSMILNKTMILQSYWTDTTDPLLLAVIYGTTIFKSQLLDGKPLELWDALNQKKRNPFLDYAHSLLAKASAEATPSRYQAIVLLALFEVTFGYPKRGMSLFGLSYMIAARLGLLDNTMPPGLNDVEKELLLVTFWSAYECTVRGCVELEQIPRDALAHHEHPYPPPNIKMSKSYQYDIESNNPRLFKSYYYLFETFYIKAVISRISCKLILQLPNNNNYVLPRTPSDQTKPFYEEKPPPKREKASNIEIGIQNVLQEFKEFNQANRHIFSPLQDYTLEMYRLFYTICLRFLRNSLQTRDREFSLHERHLPDLLDLTDVNNILNLQLVLPDAMMVIDRTFAYLSDPKAHEENCVFLPRGIIISAMDAACQALMYSYRLEPNEKARYYLDLAVDILNFNIVFGDWGTAELLKVAVQDFLRQHPPIIIIPDILNQPTFNMNNVFTIGNEIRLSVSTSTSTSSTSSSSTSSSTVSATTSATTGCNKPPPAAATDFMTSFLQQHQNSNNYLDNPWLTGNEDWIQDINNIIFNSSALYTPTDRSIIIEERYPPSQQEQEQQRFLTNSDFDILNDLF